MYCVLQCQVFNLSFFFVVNLWVWFEGGGFGVQGQLWLYSIYVEQWFFLEGFRFEWMDLVIVLVVVGDCEQWWILFLCICCRFFL